MRLDLFISTKHPQQSRSTWQKLIKAGHVRVNGAVVTTPKIEITENDRIDITEPTVPDFSTQSLPIIYEDENVIVINKPVGVLTHAKGALNDEFTVAEFVRSKTNYKTDTNRPGIVHRLDRDTSGVLLCVKTYEVASYTQKQFSNRTLKKHYIAIVEGVPEHESAVINVPIGRNPAAPSTFRADPNGKSAETSYTLEHTNGVRSRLDLFPKTGRTHQLRVHMKHIQTPIVGDRVYGKPAERLYLHARSLEITLPGGKRTIFEAPVPHEFDEALSRES